MHLSTLLGAWIILDLQMKLVPYSKRPDKNNYELVPVPQGCSAQLQSTELRSVPDTRAGEEPSLLEY